jgi:hypothetical protein
MKFVRQLVQGFGGRVEVIVCVAKSLQKHFCPKICSSPLRVARFFVIQYTKTGKIYQMTTKLQNGHKMYQHLRPFKICPNWYFWFEKIPSGNPAS